MENAPACLAVDAAGMVLIASERVNAPPASTLLMKFILVGLMQTGENTSVTIRFVSVCIYLITILIVTCGWKTPHLARG
jgi:hypothetical protein